MRHSISKIRYVGTGLGSKHVVSGLLDWYLYLWVNAMFSSHSAMHILSSGLYCLAIHLQWRSWPEGRTPGIGLAMFGPYSVFGSGVIAMSNA